MLISSNAHSLNGFLEQPLAMVCGRERNSIWKITSK
jgi:hypothetical protein